MSTKEEAGKSKGFEFCQSFMDKCCNPDRQKKKRESLILKTVKK